jgi:hypothetical protein
MGTEAQGLEAVVRQLLEQEPSWSRAWLLRVVRGEATEEDREVPRAWRRGFDAFLAALTPEQASLIRHLRVSQDATWRAVAAGCHAAWDAPTRRAVWGVAPDGSAWAEPDSQPIGMELCKRAAILLGEDPDAPPWN